MALCDDLIGWWSGYSRFSPLIGWLVLGGRGLPVLFLAQINLVVYRGDLHLALYLADRRATLQVTQAPTFCRRRGHLQ